LPSDVATGFQLRFADIDPENLGAFGHEDPVPLLRSRRAPPVMIATLFSKRSMSNPFVFVFCPSRTIVVTVRAAVE
jgi:hypothetical protein